MKTHMIGLILGICCGFVNAAPVGDGQDNPPRKVETKTKQTISEKYREKLSQATGGYYKADQLLNDIFSAEVARLNAQMNLQDSQIYQGIAKRTPNWEEKIADLSNTEYHLILSNFLSESASLTTHDKLDQIHTTTQEQVFGLYNTSCREAFEGYIKSLTDITLLWVINISHNGETRLHTYDRRAVWYHQWDDVHMYTLDNMTEKVDKWVTNQAGTPKQVLVLVTKGFEFDEQSGPIGSESTKVLSYPKAIFPFVFRPRTWVGGRTISAPPIAPLKSCWFCTSTGAADLGHDYFNQSNTGSPILEGVVFTGLADHLKQEQQELYNKQWQSFWSVVADLCKLGVVSGDYEAIKNVVKEKVPDYQKTAAEIVFGK